MSETPLREADKLEVVVLVDNCSDFFLANTEVVKRLRVLPPGGPGGAGAPLPRVHP